MVKALFGRDSARLIAAGRVALGVGFLLRPGAMPRLMGIDSGTVERTSWFGRMFGAREVALGAGLLLAGSPEEERRWLLGGALSDAVDAVAFAEALRRGLVRTAVGASFVAAALSATGTEVAAWLDSRE